MSFIFQPKIELPAGAVPPDSYDGSDGLTPPDGLVVSRNRDGTAASTYGERVWNLSAYHPEHRATNLHFWYWNDEAAASLRESLSRETRWIMFVLLWKLPGPLVSLSTLRGIGKLLRALALFAETHSYQVRELLRAGRPLREFVKAHCAGYLAAEFSGLLGNLARMGKADVGFEVAGADTRAELMVLHRKWYANIKQVAPMPTRIYSAVLASLSEELTDWNAVATSYLAMVKEFAQDPLVGRSLAHQRYCIRNNPGLSAATVPALTFAELQAKHGVAPYMLSKRLPSTVAGLITGLLGVQAIAKLTIQAFSGMREDEARSLPYDCLETIKRNDKLHYVIQGRTTKLNHGQAKCARWVTNQEGSRAIQIAKEIADIIYFACGTTAQSEDSVGRVLFVSSTYIGPARNKPIAPQGVYRPARLDIVSFPEVRTRLEPVIKEEDLRELEQLDPHRAWRTEEQYAVGRPWTLKSHQFRRSLALYAQRSGLVSLPSLRRQLQHITNEMSRYYARGSQLADDFLGTNTKHFGYEWQETQAESSALSYIFNVLMSDVAMSGGHANWVKHRLRNADGTVVVDRAQTMRWFKKGDLAYRETILGGCTSTGECDQRAFDWLDLGCLAGCPNMVVKLPNVERVIAALTKHVANLDSTSLEYRTERAKLDQMIATRSQILQQQVKEAPNE